MSEKAWQSPDNTLGLLLLLFIALKLTKLIDWSWWWVLSPVWIPLGLVLVGCFIYVGVGLFRKKT